MLYLFVGIESYNWTLADFQPVIAFAKANGVDGLIIKAYEVTQGEWYNGQFPAIVQAIKDSGIDVLPYGFFYGGDTLATEAQEVLRFLSTYGQFCMNMEGAWDGQSGWCDELHTALAGHTGNLYVSTWANIADHNWSANVAKLADIVSVWMPECYSDQLTAYALAQWPKGVVVQPTISLYNDLGVNTPAKNVVAFGNKSASVWEWSAATQNKEVFVALDAALRGQSMTNLVLNSSGMVANFVPTSQFEANETEFACGFFSTALCKFSMPPNKATESPAEALDEWADKQYDAVYGSHGATMTGGISIDQLHTCIHNAGNLHYWDIPISASTKQSDDIARIKRALAAGYPVIATIVEASVRDVTGDIPAGNPYEWNPSGTHVIVWCGVDSHGNLLAVDPANVVGPLQGSNHVRPWPRHYDIGPIDDTFATVVQLVGPDPTHPWLKPIPSGDPLDSVWTNFNAQLFVASTPTPPVPPAIDYKALQMEAYFGALGHGSGYNLGIGTAWQKAYNQFGPAVTDELSVDADGKPYTDWNGSPIVVRFFLGGWAEYNKSTNKTTLYKWS